MTGTTRVPSAEITGVGAANMVAAATSRIYAVNNPHNLARRETETALSR